MGKTVTYTCDAKPRKRDPEADDRRVVFHDAMFVITDEMVAAAQVASVCERYACEKDVHLGALASPEWTTLADKQEEAQKAHPNTALTDWQYKRTVVRWLA